MDSAEYGLPLVIMSFSTALFCLHAWGLDELFKFNEWTSSTESPKIYPIVLSNRLVNHKYIFKKESINLFSSQIEEYKIFQVYSMAWIHTQPCLK